MADRFVNWARTVRSRPTAWFRPTSEAALADRVARARAEGRRVKASGTRHSWSPVAAGDDVQVELHTLPRVFTLDPAARTVTVDAGTTLRDLSERLDPVGWALPILGSVDAQTVAGAVATATHGSSLRHGNLATLVRAMRIVDGTGALVDLDGDHPDLPGARVHLGALGVVTRLTLDVVPRFTLRETRTRLDLDEAAERLPELAAGAEFSKVWWMPHTRQALWIRYDRVDEPAPDRRLVRRLDALTNQTAFPALLHTGGWFPGLIPSINQLVARTYLVPCVRTGRSDHLFTLPMPPRHRETELAFHVHEGGEVLRDLDGWLRRTGSVLDFLVEIRFVRSDDHWMSPAHGRDTCQFGPYATFSPDTDACFAWFHALGRERGARPHWGKAFHTTPAEIRALYPRAADFVALARRMDPDGLFRTPFLDSILGPSR